jgi:phage gp36-like protein
MSTITYCDRADLEAVWSAAAIARAVDDDEDGALSASEEGFIATAIERAANLMNALLAVRYQLADLAGNDWCRDVNAVIAVYCLATRRGNKAPDEIARQYESMMEDLRQIEAGRMRVPQASESLETTPTVSNFDTNLAAPRAKVRRVDQTSTGSQP